MEPPHCIAVVAMSWNTYKPDVVGIDLWEHPSIVLNEELRGVPIALFDFSTDIERGNGFSETFQHELLSTSLDLKSLIPTLVPVVSSSLIVLRTANPAAAAAAAMLVAGILRRRGGTLANPYFLDHANRWGPELALAICLVKPHP